MSKNKTISEAFKSGGTKAAKEAAKEMNAKTTRIKQQIKDGRWW